MYVSIIRKSLVSIIVALALFTNLLGTASAHPAQMTRTATKHAFNRHDVLPIRPLLQYARKLNVGANGLVSDVAATLPPCLTSTVPPRCYSPQQIRNAYNIQPLLKAGITGKGNTVVLIDFATSPSLQADVHLYDQLYGLKDPKINVISPFSAPSVDPTSYEETALDVETVHSIAPDATIDLVLANADNLTDYNQILTTALQSTQYAVQNNLGDVISQSFGVGESCVTPAYIQAEQQVFAAARAKDITVLASAGDTGASVITCSSSSIAFELGVDVPAADPLVTAVGGTTLNATAKTGQYAGETVWNEPITGGATGGGISTLFPLPQYQKTVNCSSCGTNGLTSRGVPDVAFDADSLTGVPVVVSQGGQTLIMPIGGTSVGSPAWAGIVALLNQKAGHRLGFLNPALYALSASTSYGAAFHDILLGDNTVDGVDFNGLPITIPGYPADRGWDPVTGVGTPIVNGLASALAR